jgi:hypothetical protein
MIKRERLLGALFVTLTFSVLLTVGTVGARPSDPTEGELDQYSSATKGGTGVSAYVWGYWMWLWMERPPYIGFVEVYFEGRRWNTTGYQYTGEMTFEYGYDGYYWTIYSDGTIIHTPYIQVRCHHAYCRTTSKFRDKGTGQTWTLVTPWAEIDM